MGNTIRVTTYPVMYSWSSGGPTGSAPSDMGQAMCSKESRTITSQAVTCVVPVHSVTRSQRTSLPRFPARFRLLNMVIVSNRCCWLLVLPPLPLPPGMATSRYCNAFSSRRLHPVTVRKIVTFLSQFVWENDLDVTLYHGTPMRIRQSRLWPRDVTFNNWTSR